eukprot:1693036-Rhodomonas_salina.2
MRRVRGRERRREREKEARLCEHVQEGKKREQRTIRRGKRRTQDEKAGIVQKSAIHSTQRSPEQANTTNPRTLTET